MPAVAMASGIDDPIFSAIEAHRKAQAAIDAHPYQRYEGTLDDDHNAVWADFTAACEAACDAAEHVLDVEPTTIAGVAAALVHFTPFAVQDGTLPDVWLADVQEPKPFSEGLLVWAARSLERLAGGTNV